MIFTSSLILGIPSVLYYVKMRMVQKQMR